MDMCGAYIKAVRENLPHAQIIFDRFHVQALVNAALDEVRRSEWRQVRGTPTARSVKGLRWALSSTRSAAPRRSGQQSRRSSR